MTGKLRGTAVLGLIWLLSGCADNPAPISPNLQLVPANEFVGTDRNLESASYAISVGDELEIKFQDHPELNETLKVRPDGNISLQLIGDLRALGTSATQLEAEIDFRYRNLGSSPSRSGGGTKEYRIAVNDELAVNFPYHAGMDQTVRVRPDGRVSLPLIGSLKVENQPPEQVEHELNQRYRQYLKNPSITVAVKNFTTMRYSVNGKTELAGLSQLKSTVAVRTFEPLEIFVGGNVEKPGVIHYRQTLTALEAIVEAGGQKLGSEMGSVLIVRKQRDKPLATMIDLANAHDPAYAGNDIQLAPYDVVIVPKNKIGELGDFVDQLGRVLPPVKNSSFSFIYDLQSAITSREAISTQR